MLCCLMRPSFGCYAILISGFPQGYIIPIIVETRGQQSGLKVIRIRISLNQLQFRPKLCHRACAPPEDELLDDNCFDRGVGEVDDVKLYISKMYQNM